MRMTTVSHLFSAVDSPAAKRRSDYSLAFQRQVNFVNQGPCSCEAAQEARTAPLPAPRWGLGESNSALTIPGAAPQATFLCRFAADASSPRSHALRGNALARRSASFFAALLLPLFALAAAPEPTKD